MKVEEFVDRIKVYMKNNEGYILVKWNYIHGDDVNTPEIEDSFDNIVEYGYKTTLFNKMPIIRIDDIELMFDDALVVDRSIDFYAYEATLIGFNKCFMNAILSIGWVKTFMAYIQGPIVASMDNRYRMMYMSIARVVLECNVDALKTLLFTDWDALAVELYETTSTCDVMSHKDAVEYYSIYNRAISNYLIGYKKQAIDIFDENNAIECKALVLRWFKEHSTNNEEDMLL